MSRKATLAFSVFGLTALIAVIAVFSLRIFFERKENSAENINAFRDLETTTASSYLVKGSFSNTVFSNAMRGFIEDHPQFLAVVIYSAEGPHYIYSTDAELLAFPTDRNLPDWSGAPVFLIRPFFEEVNSSEIAIPTRSGIYVSAVTVLLPQSKLFLFIRDTIIMVAGLLVITIIFIAITPFITSGRQERSVPVSAPENAEAEPLSKTRVDAKEPSSGLFSPETGLGWQQYLDSRLSFELRRSASYDQDLVLVLFRGENLNRGTKEYNDVAQFMLKHFLFQDMLFEYGRNGFSVILPNTELDAAIKEAEAFRDGVCTKKISNCTLSAGLSSRNGRLINGSRLINEASAALGKAMNDSGSKIIAFRSDPEKYRQFIASRT